jgi:hypothetical protein
LIDWIETYNVTVETPVRVRTENTESVVYPFVSYAGLPRSTATLSSSPVPEDDVFGVVVRSGSQFPT